MTETLDPITKELLINSFGEIPELEDSDPFRGYFGLTHFDLNKGVAHFETNPSPYSDITWGVDYVTLDAEGLVVARRDTNPDGKSVTYGQGNKLFLYENFGSIASNIYIYQPAQRRGWHGISIARGLYVYDKLNMLEFTPAVAQNDQLVGLRARRFWTDMIFGGTNTSPDPFWLPTIKIEVGDEISASLKNIHDRDYGEHSLGKLEIGSLISPEEATPYRFKVSDANDRFILTVDDAQNWSSGISLPARMGLQELGKMIDGENWTTVSQMFPVGLLNFTP